MKTVLIKIVIVLMFTGLGLSRGGASALTGGRLLALALGSKGVAGGNCRLALEEAGFPEARRLSTAAAAGAPSCATASN